MGERIDMHADTSASPDWQLVEGLATYPHDLDNIVTDDPATTWHMMRELARAVVAVKAQHEAVV
jgi:hypothetical protein